MEKFVQRFRIPKEVRKFLKGNWGKGKKSQGPTLGAQENRRFPKEGVSPKPGEEMLEKREKKGPRSPMAR